MMELDILVSFADMIYFSSCRALSRMISEGHMLLALLCMPMVKGTSWCDSVEIYLYAVNIITIKCVHTLSMTASLVELHVHFGYILNLKMTATAIVYLLLCKTGKKGKSTLYSGFL